MTNYLNQLEVKSPTEIILNSEDGSPNETFSLERVPSPASVLVLSSRKDILQTIKLDELFSNLNRCVPLLNITYNAVNGTGLSSTVTRLKDKFSDTLSESIVIMTGFKTGTEDAMLNFLKAYKFMTDIKYTKLPAEKNGISQACSTLEKIQTKAAMMQNDAVKLSATFEEIEKIAQDVTKKIMEERDTDYKKKEEMEKNLNILNSRIGALKEVKEDLDTEVDEYTKQYEDVSRKIDSSEKRAYKLALASTIIGGIGALFGSVVSSGVKQERPKSSDVPQQNDNSDAAKEKYEAAQKSVEEYNSKIKETDKQLEEIKEKIKTEEDEEKKDALNKQQDDLQIEKKELQTKLESAKTQAETYKKAFDDIVNATNKIGKKLEDMSLSMDKKAESLYTHLNDIAKQKAAVAKERRATIQQLSEMTSQIANASAETRDLTMVYNALVMAVGCMRIVKVYLSDIEIFWKNVAKFCGLLIDGIKNIKDDVKNIEGVENYIEFFTDKDFVALYLINLSKWTALNSISTEYLEAFNKTRKDFNDEELGNQENPDPRVHWRKAKEVAQTLQGELNRELNASEV